MPMTLLDLGRTVTEEPSASAIVAMRSPIIRTASALVRPWRGVERRHLDEPVLACLPDPAGEPHLALPFSMHLRPLGSVSRDRLRPACEVFEMSRLSKTPDPLAPAQVVTGRAGRTRSQNPMFKRVLAWARPGDGTRSRDGLVH
jgi:hypothetical protein